MSQKGADKGQGASDLGRRFCKALCQKSEVPGRENSLKAFLRSSFQKAKSGRSSSTALVPKASFSAEALTPLPPLGEAQATLRNTGRSA
jgi:hypothetical protein